VVVPTAHKHLIQHQGRSTLPQTCAGKSRIHWLNGKDEGHLHAMVVMPVLTDTMYHYGQPQSAVTLLKCQPKLINVKQLLPGHLEHTERRRTVPKPPHAKLHVRVLRLVAFGRRYLLCYV
jgi:hypothetical protein